MDQEQSAKEILRKELLYKQFNCKPLAGLIVKNKDWQSSERNNNNKVQVRHCLLGS